MKIISKLASDTELEGWHQTLSLATGDLTGLLIGHLTPSAERIRGPEKGRAQVWIQNIWQGFPDFLSVYTLLTLKLWSSSSLIFLAWIKRYKSISAETGGPQRKLAGVAINIENKSCITVQIGQRLVSNNWSPKQWIMRGNHLQKTKIPELELKESWVVVV